MIIDTSYFKGQLEIAQVTEASVSQSLQMFINKLEPEFLEKLFGYELYKQYGLHKTDQRFVDIVTGAEYTDSVGVLRKWQGLQSDSEKKSPIANYVYFHWLRSKATATLGKGEKEVEAQNTIIATSINKQVRAWNEMVSNAKDFSRFMVANINAYPEYRGTRRELFTCINQFGI